MTERDCNGFEQTDYALATGGVSGSIGTDSPGKAGYMPSHPKDYQDDINGPDSIG